jgi:hypothetical protein
MKKKNEEIWMSFFNNHLQVTEENVNGNLKWLLGDGWKLPVKLLADCSWSHYCSFDF